MFQKSTNPLSLLLYLKGANGDSNSSAPRLMGQLAQSGEPPRPPEPSRGQVSGPRVLGPGAGAGVAACRFASSLARWREVPGHHSTRGLGAGRVWAPAGEAGTSAGTERCRAATCEAGAERAELTAGFGNPRPPPLIRP